MASYLDCDPKRLVIALRHLAENPSVIEYEIDKAASISPMVAEAMLVAAAEYLAIRHAWDLYRTMKPSEAKWLD